MNISLVSARICLVALFTWAAFAVVPSTGLAQTASLSGTVTYAGRQAGEVWVLAATNAAMPTDMAGTFAVQAAVSAGMGAFSNATFTIANLPAESNYWLFAWRDSNSNATNDASEARAVFAANPLLLTNDITDVVLTLADPDDDNDGLPDWWQQQYGLTVFSDGSDGPLTVPAGQTHFTDAVRAGVVGANPSNSLVLNVSSTNGFNPNHVALIVAMQDPNTDLAQNIAGRYEFVRIAAVSNQALMLTRPLSNSFSVSGSQQVQVVRVPQFTSVTLDGVLTCNPWNGTNGGVVAFGARTLAIGPNGAVTATAMGFRGGPDYALAGANGFQGESFAGSFPTRSTGASGGGGGGGGHDDAGAGNGGGGGGHGSAGQTGLVPPGQSGGNGTSLIGGAGGGTYGTADLSRIHLGSGGGSGGQDPNDANDGNPNGGYGGTGGGVVIVFAESVTNLGCVTANGQDGADTALEERGYGGGGSGGSLWLATKHYSGSSNITALGGRGGGPSQLNAGGVGGVGRIRFNLEALTAHPESQPVAGYVGNVTELPSVLISPKDTDGDGLPDDREYLADTDPTHPDTDRDGLPDVWEVDHGLDPRNPADAALSLPDDRLTNLQKYRYGLNPRTADADGDDVDDYDELFVHGTNPLNTDTDGDGMLDGWEVKYGLNSTTDDTAGDLDFDGLSNWQEYEFGQTNALSLILNPTSRFSLTNGLTDYEHLTGKRSVTYFYDRNDRLTGAQYDNGLALYYQYDGNGNLLRQLIATQNTSALPLVWRRIVGLTNNTGTSADYADADGDGWSNFQEWRAGSDPMTNASQPDVLGLPGTNIASLALPFAPSNFVVGVGQLDRLDVDEIVLGADGDPGTNANFLLVLSQDYSAWTSQRVDVGPFGITSIAMGQATNRPNPSIYVGLRSATGTGCVAEVTRVDTHWTVTTIAASTNSTAFVLGLRSTNDLLVSLAATNAPDGALSSLAFGTNWALALLDTNTSHRGLGTLGRLSAGDATPVGIRLLDAGGIGLSKASSPITMTEPVATSRINWPGRSLCAGFPRASFTNLPSVLYAYLDDRNATGQPDEGDEFVLVEYQVSGSQSMTNTFLKRRLHDNGAASHGLALVNYLNQTNQLLFTAEPDGRVVAWAASGATNPLVSRMFSAHHTGTAWHALANVRIPQRGEGLIGLRADPAVSNSCDIVLWPPQMELWAPADLPQTAPVARLLLTPNSGSAVAYVRIRLWDAEGNASRLRLQYELPGAATWQDATITRVNGVAWTPSIRVAALPDGVNHVLEWNVSRDLGPSVSTEVLVRVRAEDLTMVGDWSLPVPFTLATPADSDGDNLPDAWEMETLGRLDYGAGDDPDLDGMSNLEEYLADTHPNDPNSMLALHLEVTGNGAILNWQGGVQAVQYLQRRPGLGVDDAWQDILTNFAPAQMTGSYTDSLGTNVMQFYRMRVTR